MCTKNQLSYMLVLVCVTAAERMKHTRDPEKGGMPGMEGGVGHCGSG